MSAHAPVAPTRRLVLIDGANSVYRAFFAIPNLRGPDGAPSNAVYGFAAMLTKVLREQEPDLIAVAFDPKGGSFRRRIDSRYKATREAQPEDLGAQIPVVRELIDAFRIPLLEVEDFEADDVIATLVAEAPDDVEIRILSTDKDLMQLVSRRVVLVDSAKDRIYDPEAVTQRFGVPPERMLDFRSLVGDPSDNIPGVKGIGVKGAAKLITQWETLENLLDHAQDVSAKRAREALLSQREEALLSKRLSTLRCDVSLPLSLADLTRREPDTERLREIYQRLGFARLLASVEGATRAVADASSRAAVRVVSDVGAFEALLEGLAQEPIALALLAGEGSALSAHPVGLAIALDRERAAYVPLRAEGLAADRGLSCEDLARALARLWPGRPPRPPQDGSTTGRARAWCGSGTQRVQALLGELGLALPTPTDDVELAGKLLDPAGGNQLVSLAQGQLGFLLESWEDVAGRGVKAVAAEQLPLERAAQWLGSQVCAVAALRDGLRERLRADGLEDLYVRTELPLTAVLARMERAGVRIDERRLGELSSRYEADLTRIEHEIFELAGEPFLVSSPKQLQRILFEKLQLPPLKKTKTGYSTAESVLEQLAARHELPGKVLEYRRLAKLKSTYIDALPLLVCERSGRIHPHFHQLGAATGRLSASKPNVQNIPIRAEQGALIREAFIPAEGRLLLSADYSQVELRILAHYSGDEGLLEAFRQGQDIHRRTAAEVNGVTLEDVSEQQRARAKAVNFGIIYGLSAFGLATRLAIATADAQATIDSYFERYQGVRRFLSETIAMAKKQRYVVTLLGRRRYLPDLASRNRTLRQAAERMAVNTVIQGTAADLIKRAMLDVDRDLRNRGPEASLILQVHDELVFEVAERDVPACSERVRSAMEGAFSLDVPLEVDIGVGRNWREAH